MSTNYLSLRSTVTYVSSGVQPSVGTVYTVGSNGNPAWTSTLVSPVQFSTFLGSSLVTGSVGYSTLTGSTLYGNSGTVSTLTGSTFVTGSVGYSTLSGSTLYATSGTVSTLNGSTITTGTLGASGTVSIGTRLQASVDGSNNFWLSLQGSETEVNRVGIGINGNATTGTVSSLSFNAGGANRMVILSTGLVGIATTNPQALLDVRGNCFLGVNGNRYLELGADSSNKSYIDFHSQDSRATDYDTRILSNGGSSTFGQGSLEFYASTFGFIGENVGIGITNPDSKLTILNNTPFINTQPEASSVNATNLKIMRLIPDGNRALYLGQYVGRITFSGADYSWNAQKIGAEINTVVSDVSSSGASLDMCIHTLTSPSDSIPTEKMRITKSGNVGIGITNPTYSMLHIANPSMSTLLRLGSSNNPGSYSTILNGVTTMYGIGFSTWQDTSIDKIGAKIMGINRAVYGANPYLVQATDIAFYVNNASGGSGNGTVDSTTEVMRIVAGGNVGIGTTSPSALAPLTLYSNLFITPKEFTIGGSRGTYYRIRIDTLSLNVNNKFTITRGSVHINGSWLGSMNLDVEFRANNCGHASEFLSYKYRQYSNNGDGGGFHKFVGRIINDDEGCAPAGCYVYLNGNFTYTFSGIGCYLAAENTLGTGPTLSTPDEPFNTAGAYAIISYDSRQAGITTLGGNVGIGTVSPTKKLDVHLTETAAWPTGIRMLQPGATSGYGPSIVFGRNDACYNLASLGFTYIGDGSQNNYITMGIACDTTTPFIITGYGRVGIGITNPSYKLHVVGDIYASANVIAMSDQRVKRDLQPLGQTLDRISSLHGYTYFRDGKDEREMGLIAQEVLTVFPEAVHYDKEQDRYGVNYGSLVAPLLESIKDLKKQVDTLTHKVLLQEQQIATLLSAQ